ncbi:hypothetical protein Hypma_011109 [Hypsizygus marmoreus]|uniref:Uncharacterized protein n=1 Tax=Hypsizygus marmoreus TaxID=39966 RepID=A0A369JTM5_HYPMA|nr:hypothetical protein Hypma_011109 [Hypsizygus marmoreus]
MHATRGIRRPSAVHLTLPLVDRHSHAFGGPSSDDDDVEETLLTVPNSRWTMSAGPKSSASMYSQDSYTISPPVFRENKVDRRRFAIAISPSQEVPWIQPGPSLKTPSSGQIFLLDLKRSTVELTTNDASSIKSTEGVVVGQGEAEEKAQEKIVGEITEVKATKDTGNVKANMKKLRISSKVLGRMLTRLSAHSSSHNGTEGSTSEEQPLLPVGPPPQILLSLPSPSLNFSLQEKIRTPKSGSDNLSFMPKNRATLPSTWKPHRPPSPLPKMLRKKHKRATSSLSHLAVASPPPPLPTRPLPFRPNHLAPSVTSRTPETMHPAYASFSTALRSPTGFAQAVHDDPWADLQMRLKARALKTATYAIHDGGIISPTST